MQQQQIDFMKRAITLSQENIRNNRGGPFGAVIAKENQIISEGTNLVTSICDPTAHAEVVAIRRACEKLQTFDLRGLQIYTSCEPCPMCLSAIYWARLDRVYFANTKKDAAKIGFDDNFIYQEIALPIAERKLPMHQLLSEEAVKVFQEWEVKPDKVLY